MERWRARLNMAADAAEPEQPPGEEPEVTPAERAEQPPPPGGEEEPAGGEFRFLGPQEQQQAGDTQALAPATEEQAAAQAQQEGREDDAAGGAGEAAAAAEEAGGEEEEDAMDAEPPGQAPEQQLLSGAANWGAGGDRKAGLEAGEAGAEQEQQKEEEAGAGKDSGGEGEGGGEEAAAEDGAPPLSESFVAAQLQRATLEDGPPPEEEVSGGGGRPGVAGPGPSSALCRPGVQCAWRSASTRGGPLALTSKTHQPGAVILKPATEPPTPSHPTPTCLPPPRSPAVVAGRAWRGGGGRAARAAGRPAARRQRGIGPGHRRGGRGARPRGVGALRGAHSRWAGVACRGLAAGLSGQAWLRHHACPPALSLLQPSQAMHSAHAHVVGLRSVVPSFLLPVLLPGRPGGRAGGAAAADPGAHAGEPPGRRLPLRQAHQHEKGGQLGHSVPGNAQVNVAGHAKQRVCRYAATSGRARATCLLLCLSLPASLGARCPLPCAGDWLHCQPLPQGQDLDAPHPPGQAQVPGACASGKRGRPCAEHACRGGRAGLARLDLPSFRLLHDWRCNDTSADAASAACLPPWFPGGGGC